MGSACGLEIAKRPTKKTEHRWDGDRAMDAEHCSRNARHYLIRARQMSRPEDRAVMIAMAAHWMEKAEQVERDKRIVQQQRQVQPRKEPEGERS